ncbi:MAG: hypothetical protein ABIJ16_07485 [Bacteroidota bacterium]
MGSKRNWLLLVLIILMPAGEIYAAGDTLLQYYDSSSVITREIPDSALAHYYSDPAYDYGVIVFTSEPETFFEKILRYIGDAIDWLMSGNGIAGYIRWIILIALIVILVLKILGAQVQGIFVSSKYSRDISIQEIEEDLSSEDMDERIRSLISEGNYREATRMLYIKLLKTFNAAGIIKWRINKTNTDYRIELIDTSWEKPFRKVSNFYDYVYYGNFHVDSGQFSAIHSEFDSIYKKMNE